jgi:hypothetical protein
MCALIAGRVEDMCSFPDPIDVDVPPSGKRTFMPPLTLMS